MSATSHLGALLWSSTVIAPETGDDAPADRFGPSSDLIDITKRNWEAFCALLPDDFDPEEQIARMTEPGSDAWDYLAHDFALTRNHHGTGFWDSGRWAEPWGDRLTALAHQFPETSLYLSSNDGEVEAF